MKQHGTLLALDTLASLDGREVGSVFKWKDITMEEVKDYPSLVDAVWKIVQELLEDSGQGNGAFTAEQIASALAIPYTWDSNAVVFGIAQANSDLVDLGYCKGHEEFYGRYHRISPVPYPPKMLPSVYNNPPPLDKLRPLHQKALQFFHEQTVCHESGITFYCEGRDIPVEEVIRALLPNETDMYTARDKIFPAINYLKEHGFVSGVITSGKFRLWPTLRGAGCLRHTSNTF